MHDDHAGVGGREGHVRGGRIIFWRRSGQCRPPPTKVVLRGLHVPAQRGWRPVRTPRRSIRQRCSMKCAPSVHCWTKVGPVCNCWPPSGAAGGPSAELPWALTCKTRTADFNLRDRCCCSISAGPCRLDDASGSLHSTLGGPGGDTLERCHIHAARRHLFWSPAWRVGVQKTYATHLRRRAT